MKRDSTSNSTDGEEPTEVKTKSMDTSSVSYIPENVFTEGLKSLECVEILLTSIKNV